MQSDNSTMVSRSSS